MSNNITGYCAIYRFSLVGSGLFSPVLSRVSYLAKRCFVSVDITVKVTIQVLLTCIAVRQAHPSEQSRRVVNCKKIVKLLSAGLCPTRGKLCPAVG